jgi:hydrogenase maturation protease
VTTADGPILVLGIGNVLLGDDGIGVHVVGTLERLAERGVVVLPPDARLVDGGTIGLALLPLVTGARAVVLVDAVDIGRAPGAIEVFDGEALGGVAPRLTSPLPVGVGDIVAAARLADSAPDAIVLVGVQPGEIAPGIELSASVRAAVPAAVEAVLAAVRRLAPVEVVA